MVRRAALLLRRSAAVSAVIGVGMSLGVAGPSVAGAQTGTAGACPTSSGVTVVVDFQRLGGGVVTRCAPGAQSDGFAALRAAGFEVTPTTRFSGFACRIDAKPAPADDPCTDTPPYDAYWSYWTAKRGGTWKYSSIGGANPGTAPEGGVQGWSFDDGTKLQPGIAPPGAAVPPVTAPPTAPVTRPPVSAPSAGGTGPTGTVAPTIAPSARPSATVPTPAPGAGSRPGDAAGAATPTTVAASAAPTGAPDASVLGTSETAPAVDPGGSPTASTAPVATTTTAPVTIELASAGSSKGDSGSPIPTLVSVGLVAAIAATAWALRRRRTGDAGASS